MDGSIWCWGQNTDGQLGIGTTGPAQDTPALVLSKAASAIAAGAGSNHTCALLFGGSVACWGLDDEEQVGIAPSVMKVGGLPVPLPVSTPTLLAGPIDARAISVGARSTCATVGGIAVRCWGEIIDTHVLDLLAFQASLDPVAAGFDDLTISVTVGGRAGGNITGAGETFFCGLSADGTVWCEGAGPQGQLGDGKASFSRTPVQVKNLSGAVGIASGVDVTCALISNGSIACWGDLRGSAQAAMHLRGWRMGQPCGVDGDCASNVCLGGFCCSSSCPSSDQSCAATRCDASGTCIYPDSGTTCGTPACSGSTLTTGACDSAGSCALSGVACSGNLACDTTTGNSCLAGCTVDSDCAAGFFCQVSGTGGTCLSSAAQGEAFDLCTQAADAANATASIAGFYNCLTRPDSVVMTDPDGYCGSGDGPGTFTGWFFEARRPARSGRSRTPRRAPSAHRPRKSAPGHHRHWGKRPR